MQFAIIGLGKFGKSVARELYKLGNQVVGMDINEKKVEQCSHFLSASLILDATDKTALRELNIQEFDAVLVSIGESLESNLLCTLNLIDLKANQIWAKAKNAAHHAILSSLGIQHIVRPENDMGILVGQSMNCPSVTHCIPLGSDLFLIHFRVQFQTTITLGMLKKRYKDIVITAIQRGEQLISNPDDETEIHPQDHLLIIGYLNNLRTLTGELNKIQNEI
ncbi:potassium channel family protein [Histophilus somni]|uniref:Potassium uptake protein n=1 Tax=Histophilus somni (strain 129Pt) TaxID=205914 RepID=Q0I2H8_HISS1|nr:TrkA family potassium uptake protein [Histophilus somni]